MPLYEFVCPNNHTTEVVLGYDDPRLTHCEECGEEVRRVYSVPTIHLKGDGFYSTDNFAGKWRQYQPKKESQDGQTR